MSFPSRTIAHVLASTSCVVAIMPAVKRDLSPITPSCLCLKLRRNSVQLKRFQGRQIQARDDATERPTMGRPARPVLALSRYRQGRGSWVSARTLEGHFAGRGRLRIGDDPGPRLLA